MPLEKETLLRGEVLQLGTRKALGGPGHVDVGAGPAQRTELRHAPLEDGAIECGVVRDHPLGALEHGFDAGLVERLARDHLVGDAVDRHRLGGNRPTRIVEAVIDPGDAVDCAALRIEIEGQQRKLDELVAARIRSRRLGVDDERTPRRHARRHRGEFVVRQETAQHAVIPGSLQQRRRSRQT